MESSTVRCASVATICGISGGSGAGKTTLAVHVIQRLGIDRVSPLAFDAYYRDLSHITMQERMLVNYDHPDSLDHELFTEHLAALRAGRSIEVPEYDFATHCRTGACLHVEARELVVLDGILLLAFPDVRELLDYAVFIDVPEDIRLERRIKRDVAHRGRRPDDVRRQFAATVAPMHDRYVQPHRDSADRVVGVDEDLEVVADETAAVISQITATA